MPTQPLAAPEAVTPETKPPAMISAENLTKIYGSHVAIRDVSFEVVRGEILGFLGPNGAGKTTTMRILTGYTPATRGRATIARHDVAREPYEARRRLGYLPENAPLYTHMKVRPYLSFMAEIKRISPDARRSAVDRAIEECGLGEVAGRTIGLLSKGFRQRVGLAQAILGDPDVLILDEPTVGLDPLQIAEIRRLIRRMAGLRTILISTHILPEVSLICDKAVVIHRGRIVASGTTDRLVAMGDEERPIMVTTLGDAGAVQERLERVERVRRVQVHQRYADGRTTFQVTPEVGADPRAEISRAVVQNGAELLEIHASGYSLEDVFLRVISSSERN